MKRGCCELLRPLQLWPYRLTVRTLPSQGRNTGSIPVRATIFPNEQRNLLILINPCLAKKNRGGAVWATPPLLPAGDQENPESPELLLNLKLDAMHRGVAADRE